MPAIQIVTDANALRGFKYFWMKNVTGFDESVHCARCLRGSYHKLTGVRMPVNDRVPIFAKDGDVIYLCGVSTPYRWSNNFHVAARIKAGSVIHARTHAGDIVNLYDCERIQFDDTEARRRFPHLSEAYLSCRNFQFGAHHFRE